MEFDENRVNRLEAKTDKIIDTLSTISSTLSAQHESLQEHMRRTAALEIDLKDHKKVDTEMHGIFKEYIDKQQGQLKVLLALLGIPAVILSVLKVVDLLK